MKLQFYIVDAFIDPKIPFSGNPAAVIILPNNDLLTDKTKQNIAAEFNLSETVFLSPTTEEQQWSIRWFTPTDEVKLCGHATVAASHILFKQVKNKHLKYKSAYHEKLEASWDAQEELIVLDFPINNCQKIEKVNWLTEIKQAVVGSNNLDRIVDVQLSLSTGKLLIRLKDDDTNEFLLQIQPDIQRLLQINIENLVKGIIVTQKPINYKSVHFWSRYFAPWVGIPEDPVTGSAHTVLTPYWFRIYQTENNQLIEEFQAKQVSKRNGLLKCQLTKDRVLIKGKAKIFCNGTIEFNEIE